MIDLPDNWRVEANGKRLNLKSLTPPELPTTERTRLRKVLRKAVLTHQLTGPEIPSLITDDYRCQAILFLDLELTELRHADFTARVIQPLLKEHAVLRLHEGGESFVLSFAHKRLSLAEDNAVVIADHYCSQPHASTASLSPLRPAALLNRLNKRDLYLEAMTKAFLIDHPQLFIGASGLLDTKLWHHGPTILALFRAMVRLHSLKFKKDRATSLAEKAALNSEIKAAITSIRSEFLTDSKKPEGQGD